MKAATRVTLGMGEMSLSSSLKWLQPQFILLLQSFSYNDDANKNANRGGVYGVPECMGGTRESSTV